tara:strand:- start:5545 stop:6048 length:504 start_codon:yes stop_codon:yes gene_type:complete
MTEQCNELKNIKYKSMLLSGSNSNTINVNNNNNKSSSLKNLDAFLEAEKARNKKESWSRLDKTIKLTKLYEWAEIRCNEKKWSETTLKQLKLYLKHCLDKKRIQKVKDVIYDKEKGKIINIPNLQFINRKFTLKRSDKRQSTLKSLGSGRRNKTIKKNTKDNSSTSS